MTNKDLYKKLNDRWNQTIKIVLEKQLKRMGKNRLVKINSNQYSYLLEKITLANIQKKKGTNKFLILSGPSGVGKGTVGKNLEKYGIKEVIRTLTRPPRKEEVEGVHGYFISLDKFMKMKDEGKFITCGERYGAWRGIEKEKFQDKIKKGEKIFLDRSVYTFKQLEKNPEVAKIPHYSIYILPPTFEDLVQRIIGRTKEDNSKVGITDPDVLKRLNEAMEHLAQTASKPYFDAYIVNDKLEKATKTIADNY